jgi:hypothetical protein
MSGLQDWRLPGDIAMDGFLVYLNQSLERIKFPGLSLGAYAKLTY